MIWLPYLYFRYLNLKNLNTQNTHSGALVYKYLGSTEGGSCSREI